MEIRRTLRGGLVALTAILAAQIAWPTGASADQKQVPSAQLDLAADGFTYSLSFQIAEASGGGMTVDRLRSMLNGADSAKAFSTVEAKRIVFPHIAATIASPADAQGQRSTTIISLDDVEFDDMRNGRAENVRIGSIRWGTQSGVTQVLNLAIRDVGIEPLLALYGAPLTGDTSSMRVLASKTTAAGARFTSRDVNCTIGGITMSAMKVKPGSASLPALAAIFTELERAKGEATTAQIARALFAYQTFLTSVESDGSRVENYSCETKAAGSPPVSIRIASVMSGVMRDNIYPEVTVEGYAVGIAGQPFSSIEKMVIKPVDLTSVVKAMKNAPPKDNGPWLAANLRSLIPAFGGFDIENASFFIPLDSAQGGRLKLDVLSLDVRLADYRNAIPTAIDIEGLGIKFDLPTGNRSPELAALQAAGLKQIDGTFRIAAKWDEADETIRIEEISVTDRKLGGLFLGATLEQAKASLFGSNTSEAISRVPDLRMKVFTIRAIDKGIIDLIARYVATPQTGEPGAIRTVLALKAKEIVNMLLAESPHDDDVAGAVQAFVSGAKNFLSMTIEAHGKGIELFELSEMAKTYPALLKRVKVSAEAKDPY